ncbi:hypothetical protein DPMN_032438 [Dreissena polymorpha]|uniref:Uncharacterized protein n=1 Tax=Dreissena polymorpha TaxID=45954 RepID=A0A9D4M3R6_DREPO|nr:hypothetical protein DPMN_032438 [Dreissena polymorpha]
MLPLVLTRKYSPPLGGHVFQQTKTIFELLQDITETNLLTKFHENRTINVASRAKNATPPGGNVFQQTRSIFKLIHNVIKTYVLTKVLTRKNAPPNGGHGHNLLTTFHEDRTINVASRMSTRKNAPPPFRHVFQATVTILELVQDIIETNLLTKFHEIWTINVASNVLTRQILTPHAGQKVITKAHHEHIVLW